MIALRRRAFSLCTALLLAVFGAQAAWGAEKIVISTWDPYMPADLLENFTKATGIDAELSLYATNEEIVDEMTASGGRGFDIVFVSSPFAEALANLGLAAELDHGQIPNLSNLYAEASKLGYDPGNRHSVPYAWGTTGLCYRSDLVPGLPSSWHDLLEPDPELVGKITMLSADRWLLAAGFKALGYSINTQNEAEIAAARDLLIEAKKNLLAYDDTTFYSKLASSEAYLAHARDGWCNYGVKENDQIRFVIPKEGSDLWVETMVVLDASEHKAAAYKFLNYVLDADTHKWVAETVLYKVPNRAAMDAVDKGLFEAFPNMGMSPGELLNLESMRDIGQAQKAYTRAVTEITAAQ